MRVLFYDFETSGLPLFDQPSGHPDQPHIVQAAAAVVDIDTRSVLASVNMIVCPDGWSIPDEVSRVHGITDEIARHVGVDEQVVVNAVLALWMTASMRIAHNESFDARIMRIALKRFRGDAVADYWKAGAAQCTARMASPIMKMAPTARMLAAGRRTPKTPKCSEAFEFFMGRPMQGAHSALADMRACMAVWFAIRDREAKEKAAAAAPAAPPAAEDGDALAFLSEE